MKLYPLMINIEDRFVVIIGGGEVALRKAKDLLNAGALLKIVSPNICGELFKLAEANPAKIEIIEREYAQGDIIGASLVFSTADNSAVNFAVIEEAHKLGIFVNGADNPEESTFHVPSFVKKGDIVFSLSTGGSSPAMAARLRREFESHIPENIQFYLEKLKRARELLKNKKIFPDYDSTRRGDTLRIIVNNDSYLERLNSCNGDDKIVSFIREINS